MYWRNAHYQFHLQKDGDQEISECARFRDTDLNLYEEKASQRAPPMAKKDYTERVEVVPYNVGWPGSEEKVLEV